MPERGLHYHLEQLVQLGYVARRRALTPQRASARSRIGLRFALDDALLRTWFRFVFDQRGEIARLGPTAAMSQLVRTQLEAFYRAGFERMAREALPLLWEAEGVPGGGQVGEYWDRQVQLDVVAVGGDGWLDLGECTWGAAGAPGALIAELDDKVARFPNPRNLTITRRVFTRTRLHRAPADTAGVRWHTLADLYGDAAPRT